MSFPVEVIGVESKVSALVSQKGELHVTSSEEPPLRLQRIEPLREFLKTSADSKDMNVNGSVTEVDFFIESDEEKDTYITTISFLIADAGATLNEFGNLSALTNGCRLFYSKQSGEIVIHDELKTNFDFIRLGLGTPPLGGATDAFRANNVSGISEGYIPSLNFKEVFGMPFGIKLDAGKLQRLVLTVRDDISTVDAFDCIVYGFRRLGD